MANPTGCEGSDHFAYMERKGVVLRLIRGESPDLLSRELGVPVAILCEWRDAFLAGPVSGLERGNQIDALRHEIADLRAVVQALEAQLHEIRTLLRPLRWAGRATKLARKLSLFAAKGLWVASVCLSALISRRAQKKGDDRRVLMLTISQIDIDPRINKVARTLVSDGYEVDILCWQNQAGNGSVLEEQVNTGVRYIRIPVDEKWSGRLALFYQEPFRRIGVARNFDYVHANDLTTLLVAWILAKARGVPLVYDAHEMWSENVFCNRSGEWGPMSRPVRNIARWYERFLVKHVDLFLTVSSSITEEFQRRYKLAQKPHLLPNFPELALLEKQRPAPTVRQLCGLSENRFVTLYLGGVNIFRNIENVIKAHQYLPDACVFVIRGPGVEVYQSQYQTLAKDLGLDGRVFCLPPVDMDDVLSGASGSDCGIVLLRNICKNFYWYYPNKFFEYMLGGLPVVASNFPDVSAHVEKEKCGLVCDPDCPKSIADALGWLYENPQESRAMGQRGREGVLRMYNWEIASKAFLQEYQQLYT